MFTHRQTHLEKALLSAVAVLLLLTTAGQSAMLTDIPQTTAATALPSSSPTTQLSQSTNSSLEEPQVLRSHRSCGDEHKNYCENGGECMYPQDNDKPFCICTSSYSGPRCLFFTDHTRTLPPIEELIAIVFGVLMLIIALAILAFCFVNKKCQKSAPLIKSAPSDSSV